MADLDEAGGHQSTDSVTAGPRLDRELIRSSIDKAESYAEAGRDAPPMQQVPALLRPAARLAGRLVRFLASFITDRQREFNRHAVESHRAAAVALATLEDRLQAVDGRLEDIFTRLDAIEQQMEAVDGRSVRQGSELALVQQQLTGDLSKERIRQLRHGLLDLQRQMADLSVAPSAGGGVNPMPAGLESSAVPMPDSFYLAFEDRFRGSREEIISRLATHLPRVQEVVTRLGAVPVIDLGCGRGEWLELLAGQGVVATGVDQNRMMIHLCREQGFDVVEADAVAYLRGLAPASVGVLTGFHLLEHLPPEVLFSLLGQAFRALRPGGLAIFETPNPENLIVGACNFYYDPTHRNPLPPEPLRFIMEQCGFEETEIVRLHPNLDIQSRWQEQRSVNLCYDFFAKEQDYAVVGRKPWA
jgi:O-antigen chain-terminating methyltransferase